MANDFRPIALTKISYKILNGIIKQKVDNFHAETDRLNDFQTGGTSGGRFTENIFILNLCIEKSFIRKRNLYIISIDLSKAFDSINRQTRDT